MSPQSRVSQEKTVLKPRAASAVSKLRRIAVGEITSGMMQEIRVTLPSISRKPSGPGAAGNG
jgi:hypothetical protein